MGSVLLVAIVQIKSSGPCVTKMVQYRPEVTGRNCILKPGEVRALFARALQAFQGVSFCSKDTTGWPWGQGDGVRGLESIVKGAEFRKPKVRQEAVTLKSS